MRKLEEGLRFGPLGESWIHLSIGMQACSPNRQSGIRRGWRECCLTS
jgi:hypothetical protein